MQFPDAAEVGEMCLLGLNNNKPEDEGLTSNILDCFYPMSTARVSTMSSGSATISSWWRKFIVQAQKTEPSIV